jgi:hypothetical protein
MNNSFYTDLSAVCRYRLEEMVGKEPASMLQHFNSADFDNSIFKLDVRVDEGKKVNISAVLKKPVAIELFLIRFRIPKKNAVISIDRVYNISKISKQIWNNSHTPLFINFSNGEHHFLLYNSWRLFSHKIINYPDFFELVIFIDAAAEHPSWDFTEGKRSKASPVLPSGTTYNIEFGILEVPNTHPPTFPVIARYPIGTDAAFMITDHCDFDDHKKLHIFLRGNTDGNGGWLGKGLKITKGVFTKRSTSNNAKTNDTLETPEYKALIKELYADGSEIAPHALNQSGQITAEEFSGALNSIQHDFAPKTWIDHGLYLTYCYYMGGKDHPGYQLIKALREKKYTSLWSYQDIPVDPNASLNHFSNTYPAFKPMRKVVRKMLAGKFLVAGHEFKSMVQRKDEAVNRLEPFLSFVSSGRAAMMSMRSSKNRKKALRRLRADLSGLFKPSSREHLPYTKEELVNFSPLLYPENGRPLHQLQDDSLLLFATQEITQLDGVYTEAALDKLTKEKGMHVGHTYILNDLPYIEGIFEKGTKYKLSGRWVKFVNALSQKVKNGEIWNSNFSEFVDWIKQRCKVSIEYISGTTMIVYNSGDTDIKGLTFIFNTPEAPTILWDKKDPAYKRDASGNLLFWGNVPANSSAVIEWQ